MNTKSKNSIPIHALSLLRNETWSTEDYHLNKFAICMECHVDSDNRHGSTSQYRIPDAGDRDIPPIRKLLESGVVDPAFYTLHEGYVSINQHYRHSLEQAMSQCQKAWNDHVARTDKLLGTASGRIYRRHDEGE